MVYRKKKTYRTRPTYKGSVARDAAKALSMAKALKNLVNIEVKSIDTQATTEASTAAGVRTAINLCAQGLDTDDRIGNSIKLQYVKLDYQLNINASATDSAVRCMVLQDKQADQALPAVAIILQDATSSDNIISPRHKDFKQRLNTLYDKVHILSANGSGKRKGQMYKKILAKVRYDGTTAAITDLETNSLIFLHITDEATNVPTVTWHARVGYVDN